MIYYQIFGRASCPYCRRAWELLHEMGLNHMFCEMENSPDLISHYKELYNTTTVPIVVEIDTETGESSYIGGCSDLIEYLRGSNEESD